MVANKMYILLSSNKRWEVIHTHKRRQDDEKQNANENEKHIFVLGVDIMSIKLQYSDLP